MNTPLTGRSLIVLEPDTFVASYIRVSLIASGAEIHDTALNLEQCTILLERTAIHAAVLSLDDPTYNPLSFAKLFRQWQIPMLFVAAPTTDLGPHPQDIPLLRKPFASFQVIEALVALLPAHAAALASVRPRTAETVAITAGFSTLSTTSSSPADGSAC